jgi:hypothetical protein
VAADGTGVDHRRHDRGGRSRFRRDLFRRGEHAHPDSLPGGTDLLGAGIHVRRTWWCPRCVWLRVLLLVCLSERVLLNERSTVIVPGHISVSECVCIRACLSVRVAESPLVSLPVSDLGTAYVQGPDSDADADHSTADIGTADIGTADLRTADLRTPYLRAPDFGTADFGTPDHGTGRIHAGERSIIRIGTRFYVATAGEKGRYQPAPENARGRYLLASGRGRDKGRNALITWQVPWSGSVASVTYVSNEASDVSVIIVNRYLYTIS